jgi:hypothetical protein
MFDELTVAYPLPDGWDPAGQVFQTKDTPSQWLERYELRADGSLWHVPTDSPAEEVCFDGELCFYTGNISGFGPWGEMTEDDQPPWVAEYTALFDDGRLVGIRGKWALRPSTRPHISRAEWHRQSRLWDRARGRNPSHG